MHTDFRLPEDVDVDLPGLSELVAPWLSVLPVADQRIQTTPDSRTLRYYQTVGLLDRPLRYDGRNARYGRRHVLQVLAVRVLQSAGLSLAQVQATLTGANELELETHVRRRLNGAAGVPVLPPVPAFPGISPQSNSAALTAVELSPGVVVTVDSRFQSDPARVIALLRRALHGDEQ